MRKVLLVLHVLAVGLHDAPDANIGAGLAMMLIGLLGLPWSWLVFDQTQDTWDDMQVWFPLAALVNLGLHWAIGAWWLARSRRRV